MYAECASCEAQVFVGKNPRIGQQVTCPSCGDVMEIVWLDPVELDWLIDDDDDEDEEDEEY